MDFVQFEAIEEFQQNEPLSFLNEEDDGTEQDNYFIDGSEQQMEDVSFYRQLDPENIDRYNKFPNQNRNPRDAVYENSEMYFGDEDN